MIWEDVPYLAGSWFFYGGKRFLPFGGNLPRFILYVEEFRRIFFVFYFVFWPF